MSQGGSMMAQFPNQTQEDQERGRTMQRTSRWSMDKSFVPGIPTILPNSLSEDQVNAFVLLLRLEEVCRKLRNNDLLPPGDKRSVSPDPVYGPGGVRMNTREARYKSKLEQERQDLIERGIASIPGFRPPGNYKRSVKLQEKVYIPIQDFPHVNFMGMIIGPRGKSLKKMESETGCKFSIRGRGSLKEGKHSNNGSEDDDMHCLVMAESEEQLKKAVAMINEIIEVATSTPDGENELKRIQLRELAALNGTLRDDEQIICLNCGEAGHKKFECRAPRNRSRTIICRLCGNPGHIAADCMARSNPEAMKEVMQRNATLDNEYASLMAEIGGSRPGRSSAPQSGAAESAPWSSGVSAGGSAAPWAQGGHNRPGSPRREYRQRYHDNDGGRYHDRGGRYHDRERRGNYGRNDHGRYQQDSHDHSSQGYHHQRQGYQQQGYHQQQQSQQYQQQNYPQSQSYDQTAYSQQDYYQQQYAQPAAQAPAPPGTAQWAGVPSYAGAPGQGYEAPPGMSSYTAPGQDAQQAYYYQNYAAQQQYAEAPPGMSASSYNQYQGYGDYPPPGQ